MSPSSESRVFPYDRWRRDLHELAECYRENTPFPHIHLSGFVDENAALQAAREFPTREDQSWTRYKHFNEDKRGTAKRADFPSSIGEITDELLSAEFVSWLSELTGIADLIADPSLDGGGMHQTDSGGFLNIHADFRDHHYRKNWRRRCNLILYLNQDWDEEWGGSIELWDTGMQRCATRIPPHLNHVLIFNTTETSFHGYPERLRCPTSVTRNSLALYYYTIKTADDGPPASTRYRSRPNDTPLKSLLIGLDNKMLKVYSSLKRRFGLSDKLASWLLGKLGRK